jgi:predicted porin
VKTLKTSLVLATLSLLGSQAAAQTAAPTLTFYGKFDIGLRKAVGEENKQIATGSDGRVGLKGTYDLGSGLQGFVNLEHRFFPDTGVQDGVFWKGIANAGLSGAFGKVGLGRQYIAAFSLVQDQIDPWGGDTVAQLRDVGMRAGGITKVRVDGSLRYDYTWSGVKLAASIAEGEKNGGPNRPVSLAANTKVGDLFLAAGYENPAGANDKYLSLGTAYSFGDVTVSAGIGKGTTNADIDAQGYLLAVNWPLMGGELKAGYATQEVDDVTTAQKVAVGFHYPLHKNVLVYADLANDRKARLSKTGADLGLRLSF